jgi:hypothetical protein
MKRIDQDLAAGAGRVRHGVVVLVGLAIRAFYVDGVGMDFEMATRNFRKRGASLR